jgi:hypothetical protein
MMSNATFNNISAISWWSVLFVEETGVPNPEKTTDLPQISDILFLLRKSSISIAN